MSEPFELFDQAEARFSKLFAGAVLLLVVGLVVTDIVMSALAPGLAPPQEPTAPKPAPVPAVVSKCKPMPDGMKICDVSPPNFATSIRR